METVRLDIYLWVVRAYKTRSQAKLACDSGRVTLNDASAKPSSLVRVNDMLVVRGEVRRTLRVVALSEVRGPAAVAKALYADLTPPPDPKAPAARRDAGAGRPTKRERRKIDELRAR